MFKSLKLKIFTGISLSGYLSFIIFPVLLIKPFDSADSDLSLVPEMFFYINSHILRF